MRTELLDFTKISRPELPLLLYRERLFDSLDDCRNCPGAWVSGPPGSGKTALMSSYVEARQIPCLWYRIESEDSDPAPFFSYVGLAAQKVSSQTKNLPVFKPEYHQDLFQFSIDFFSRLFAQLERRSMLVLDNYQEIPEEIALHALIIDSFKRMPEGIQVVFISRNEPSPKFSHLKVNRRIHSLGWEDIRFSYEDYLGLAELLGMQGLPERSLKRIYDKMGGWITGLLFLLEDAGKNQSVSDDLETASFEEIFYYLEKEAFADQKPAIKRFLLKSSLFPYVTNGLARDLTGNPGAQDILASLRHHNLFTEKQTLSGKTVYRYHQMFREFLADRMADFFTADESAKIKHRAASLLRINDQHEEAAELFRVAGDLDSFIDVAVQRAPVLLAQGKHKILEDWFSSIPRKKFDDNPWLYNWLGTATQSSHPVKAREQFRKAFDAFTAQNNMTGAYSSWTGLVRTIIGEWNGFTTLDPLIDWLETNNDHESDTLTEGLRCEVATCMTEALMIRRPQSREIRNWAELSMSLAQDTDDINSKANACLTAANYYHWLGDHSSYEVLLDKAVTLSLSHEVSSSVLLKMKFMEAGMYAWHRADGTKCLQVVEDALEIAKAATHHPLDHLLYVVGVCGAILAGDLVRAENYLLKDKTQYGNNPGLCAFCRHYVSARLYLLRGDKSAAAQHALEALKKASESGYIFYEALGRFAVARTLYVTGKHRDAVTHLACFGEIAESTNSRILKYMFFLEKSRLSFDEQREEEGREYLRTAMALGRQQNYINMMCWWEQDVMVQLVVRALELDIETEYVKNLINRRDLAPAFPPIEIEQWPWPMRIYTLGRFEIVCEGKPLRFKGKAQLKPLNMLKALIAFGGRNVSEFRLAEALWPEADGDLQHQSLATTLHRLRRMVGHKEFIHYHNGHLSLDARYCWVDAWAFERLLSRAEAEASEDTRNSSLSAARCAEKAICLYKGDFLPQVNREHWCMNRKESLKSRFLRGVIFLGRRLEKSGEQEKAASHYLKALEIEPLMEEFYQRLMVYYQGKGKYADAALLYQRCRKNFETFLNVQPSEQTNSLYRNILRSSEKMINVQN